MSPKHEQARTILRWTLAAIYLVAGIGHLLVPDKFLAITPAWVPAATVVIFVTGLCEIAGAFALLTQRWRGFAAIMLAIYAVCVFPANIKHAVDGIALSPIPDSWWYHGPRLAFQPVLMWWPLFCAGVIDWPWRKPAA